ncbi:hypothetical protein FDECE_15960 [Fusarium decemcellulare]|nr:hypothetical protein FDECE_15960 [Fusarium decemcellulare]
MSSDALKGQRDLAPKRVAIPRPRETAASKPRPRRPPIFRVKTGCFTCRGRKKKCDEIKPICTGCKRNKLSCRWPTSAEAVRGRQQPAEQPQEHEQATGDPSSDDAISHEEGMGLADLQEGPVLGEAWSPALSSINVGQDTSPTTQASFDLDAQVSVSPSGTSYDSLHQNRLPDHSEDVDQLEVEVDQDYTQNPTLPLDIADDFGIGTSLDLVSLPSPPCQTEWDSVPRGMPLLPTHDSRSFELLSYYLSRTALSMGNGSTVVNPFISQLVPLSFANNLILDLVLCQSAAHRAIEDNSKLTVAHGYYNKSIRLFREAVQNYVTGKETNPLWIVVGSLIMCFTETAKGDVKGTIFDHIKGAGPLLANLIARSDILRDDLKDFIVEYYVYTASISMISIDPESDNVPFLSSEMEWQGQRLISSGYIGQLCGCWFELLLMIPRIFKLGQRSRGTNGDRSSFPMADDFLTFSTLQAQILLFQPFSLLGEEVTLCGQIFKQATHLYLLTSLNLAVGEGGLLKQSMDNSVDQAFEALQQVPATARINTSLCWALAVIGSCVVDEVRRNELRARLDIMFLMIGLGNIRSTLSLLEHIWALPENEQSPWVIWRVMRDNQLWISFA